MVALQVIAVTEWVRIFHDFISSSHNTIIGCICCMLQSVEHHSIEIETVMSGSY
jgi:hypothetical protein